MTSSMILTPARVMTPVNETHTTHMKSMKTMSMKTKITAYMRNIKSTNLPDGDSLFSKCVRVESNLARTPSSRGITLDPVMYFSPSRSS